MNLPKVNITFQAKLEKYHSPKGEYHCRSDTDLPHGPVKVSTGILRYDKRVEPDNL